MYAYPKLQVLMIAALNQERLKLTPDVSVEHWLLLRIEALILKHWTWVSSQYQWHRRSLITTRFGSRSMDFMASNFETGMNNRITWTEDMIFNFDPSLQVLLQYGGAGSDTINAARDADGFTAIMQVGWFGSSIDNMIVLMEDILPNLLKKCKSLDIYSLARNDLTRAGCPSRGGPIKMA